MNNRDNSLKNIYNSINFLGLLNGNIDIDTIKKDIKHMNFLMYQTYKIFKSEIHDIDKIKLLSELKDRNGNILFTEETAYIIYYKFKDKLVNIYDKIIENRKKYSNFQHGGGSDLNSYKNNKINQIYEEIKNNPEINQNYNNIDRILNINNKVNALRNIFQLNKNETVVKQTFEWIFFPLYKLENTPLVGFMFEIPLDIVGIIIDLSGLILGLTIPYILKAITVLGSMSSGIPYAGSIIAPINTMLVLGNDQIEWLLSSSLDILGFFINLQRKQFGLAYISALSIFPTLHDTVDLLLTNVTTLNKHWNRFNETTEIIKINTNIVKDCFKLYDIHPDNLMKSDLVWDKIIKPNYNNLELFNKIPEVIMRDIFITIFGICNILFLDFRDKHKFKLENILINRKFNKV